MVGLLIFGVPLGGVGLAYVWVAYRDWRKWRRLHVVPVAACRDLGSAGPVRVRGEVVAGKKGMLSSPLSKEDCAWWRIEVRQAVAGGTAADGDKRPVLDVEYPEQPLLIDDGTGVVAVYPGGAPLSGIAPFDVRQVPDPDRPGARLERAEIVIEPGEVLHVLGTPARDAEGGAVLSGAGLTVVAAEKWRSEASSLTSALLTLGMAAFFLALPVYLLLMALGVL